MDAPIAPAAVRPAEEGPAYDVVSLGLVLFTILLIGVWTPYFFRQDPPDMKAFARFTAGVNLDTAEGNLAAARWADINLHRGDCRDISPAFREHLKKALEMEARERANLLDQVRNLPADRTIAARAELSEHPEGEALTYARQWYRNRAAWLEARDARGFNRNAHIEFKTVLLDVGMGQEAAEQEKIVRSGPGGAGDDEPHVIREHGQVQPTK